MLIRFISVLTLLSLPMAAAERKFDFSEVRTGQTPPGFRSVVTGQGKPGDWKVILDETPSALPPLTPQEPAVARKAVLAQLAQDPTDEHFSLLVFEEEIFGDFTLTTRFKTVRGLTEQMAGMAFRIQNETNYYVVRASSLGNTFRFYKVLNGERGPLAGPETPVPSGVWQDLTIECKGNQVRCLLNGKELITVEDKVNPLTSGKIGFWTKSDSVSYFADTKIVYTPREPPAQTMLREFAKTYPRLLDLKLYVTGKQPQTPRLVAGKDPKAPDRPAGKAEADVC